MGPGGGATPDDLKNARQLGNLIAANGWILLSGGRNEGVMDEVNKGAKENDGLTIGIMPTSELDSISDAVDIPIITDMKSARNTINVLSSDVIVACGIGAGTASEIALALKANKDVILLNNDDESKAFFQKLGKDKIYIAESPDSVIKKIKKLIGE